MSGQGERIIRVLVVDGHEAVRRALQIRLSVPSNLDVVGVAANLSEAIELKQLLKPDVIVIGLQKGSDEDLQRISGPIRQLSQPPTGVIALVPYADAFEREVLLESGVQRYLLKHINSQLLVTEIEEVASVSADY